MLSEKEIEVLRQGGADLTERGNAVSPTRSELEAFLEIPNSEFDDMTPKNYLLSGGSFQVVADLHKQTKEIP